MKIPETFPDQSGPAFSRRDLVRLSMLAALFGRQLLSSAMAEAGGPKKLTGTISFEALEREKIKRAVEWTNPDGSHEQMEFVEMAIPVDKGLEEQTRRFVKENYNRSSIWLDPQMIVFHSMDLGTLKDSLEASSFLNDTMPTDWGDLSKAGLLPNGAHFMIDRDGTVYCLTPPQRKSTGKGVSYDAADHEWLVRRHQDGNPCAIGIENVTPANGNFDDLSIKQIEANAKLARWLIPFEQGKIRYLTSHHQFNDVATLKKMHRAVGLEFIGKTRTEGRQDVGNDILNKIVERVKSKGFSVKTAF